MGEQVKSGAKSAESKICQVEVGSLFIDTKHWVELHLHCSCHSPTPSHTLQEFFTYSVTFCCQTHTPTRLA